MKQLVVILLLSICSSVSGQQAKLNVGDTVFFDFRKNTADLYDYLLANDRRGVRMFKADGIDPFNQFGIISEVTKLKNGKPFVRIRVHTGFSTIYGLEEEEHYVATTNPADALISKEIRLMRVETIDLMDLLFLKESKEQAEEYLASIRRYPQKKEIYAKMLNDMIINNRMSRVTYLFNSGLVSPD